MNIITNFYTVDKYKVKSKDKNSNSLSWVYNHAMKKGHCNCRKPGRPSQAKKPLKKTK